MVSVVLEDFDHHGLHALDVLENPVGHVLFQEASAIEAGGLRGVVSAVLQKAHQARQIHLAVLGGQKFLQVVVAQGGVFHIDLADDAHLDLGHPVYRDGSKLLGNLRHGGLDLAVGPALVLANPAADGVQPFLLAGRRRALFHLIGLRLGLQCRQAQGDDRHMAQPRLLQGLAQQVDVVGGPAAAAGLGDDEGGVVQVVLPGAQGVQELADNKQRRVAGVVVDIFQAQFADLAAAVLQQLAGVARLLHHRRQNAELHRGHVRDQNFMGLFHLRSKLWILHRFHILMPPFASVRPGRRKGSAGGCAPRPNW